MKDTVYFIVISLIMVVMAYFVAFGCEKLIEKKTHVKFSSEKTKVNKLVIMAMLSAVAVVLMYFDFPLVFLAPGFYKLDFSEVPVLIGSFLLGPCAGVIIEAVKVLLHMCLKGTTTAFVGDFANFILGCAYVVPAAVIYHLHKTKKNGGCITDSRRCYFNYQRNTVKCLLSAAEIFAVIRYAGFGIY